MIPGLGMVADVLSVEVGCAGGNSLSVGGGGGGVWGGGGGGGVVEESEWGWEWGWGWGWEWDGGVEEWEEVEGYM